MENLSKLAIIVSLSLTMPYIFYCIEIGKLWSPSLSDENVPGKRLARGIFYGFFASGLDNIYWGVAWLFFLFESPVGTFLIGIGSLANIFFRQLGGIYAAREHVLAANMMHRSEESKVHNYYWISSVLCFLALSYLAFT